MNLIDLYQSLSTDKNNSDIYHMLLTQTHWFVTNADFDPKTGEALPQTLSGFLARIMRPINEGPLHDRLWRITEHARPSVERLFHTLNESPRREQAMLPVRAVRELDANSFVKLSNRPGRNIREKLAGKPYLQAVRRFQSIDLPENRLLKAFVTRLAELLELRRDCLGEEEDELLPKIHSWLRSSEAQAIARWDNLPPNNTLLSHRDYRCIWDAWRWLQTIDDDIARDFSQYEVREETMRDWNEYALMYTNESHLFAEIPLILDYENFAIRPWLGRVVFHKATQRVTRSLGTRKISKPVCVDLAVLHPYYATAKSSSSSLHDTYLWQRWKSENESVDIELFNADAAYLHPDAITISSSDLFFSKDNTLEYLDCAARAFASKLRDTFTHDTLIWLVPDFLNDFELEITRRNINARFPDAEPLPRSIAAIFEQVDYSKIKNDGFPIVVVDTIGGKTCVTKLIARFDPELKERLSETNGYYWERCPPVIVTDKETENVAVSEYRNYDIITIDSQGNWRKRIQTEKPPFIDLDCLKDKRIGHFAFCINLNSTPVTGGIHLHFLQQRVGNIPLWRDQIPELSIKVKDENYFYYHRFYLVSRGTTVKPIRGLSVRIPVPRRFTLPAGQSSYQFPLFQGENANELGFSARLDSPAFPLKKNTVCELELTFEYGADEPYRLIFSPLDKSFPPVCAIWQHTVEEIITDAPSPEYPTPKMWEDLCRMPKPNSNETSDFLEWVVSAIDRLDRDLFIRPRNRTLGKIFKDWRENDNGYFYTLAECSETGQSVYIHEKSLVEGVDYEDFEEGDAVSFELQEYDGNFTGRRVAKPDYKEETQLRKIDHGLSEELIYSIHKSLYVPFIQVWRDGRSITNKTCPKDFAKTAEDKIAYLSGLLSHKAIPQSVKKEILFLLACLHKDTSDDCVQWIIEQVDDSNIHDPQSVGFSLGDVSEKWQQYIFSSLALAPNTSAISVFAYAIWREQHFVERFSISELQVTLKELLRRLTNICSVKPNDDELNDKENMCDWLRATTETLELLLGLLRTRASTDPEIRMLLQPHQNITKKLVEQVEGVIKLVADLNVNLFSRIQLDIQKPAGDRTPDLLYALRLYLTGDDGAKSIRITSVSDDDND